MLRDVMRWDDALDVWSIHGMGGFYGSIALGFLADEVSHFFFSISHLNMTPSKTYHTVDLRLCLQCGVWIMHCVNVTVGCGIVHCV